MNKSDPNMSTYRMMQVPLASGKMQQDEQLEVKREVKSGYLIKLHKEQLKINLLILKLKVRQ